MRKLYLILVLCMIWTNVALADETIDGITYTLNTSTSTATVTNTPSGSVAIPATVTYNNRKYNVTAIKGVNSGVTSIEIPEGVTSIGIAFKEKESLTSIIVPSTVQQLEKNAFFGCSSLISVTLSEGLTYIGENAFYGCTQLPNITIPSTIISMGADAFMGCRNLKKITWNAKHCADFEASPFYTMLYFDNTSYDFWGNDYTTQITFGDEVEYIPAYLCSGFYALSTIVIPNSVKEIGSHAFDAVRSTTTYKKYKFDTTLSSISFGTELEKIGSYAFYGRSILSELTIPDKCTTIDPFAFAYCSNLSTITMGKCINTIGTYTFGGTPSINTINIYAITPPIITGKNVFGGLSIFNNNYALSDLMAITLNVRSKALDAYKSAAVWKDMYVQVMENDIRTFTLSVSSADESKGTTTQGGAYDEDSEILIYAAAKDGYKFSKWNDGNTENPRTVKMIGNLSFVAQFEPFIPVPTYTITTSANAVEGSVVGGGIYESGTQVALAAIGNTGYHFTQWSDGNTTNPRQITVTSNGSYTALFAKDPAKYTLTTSSTNVTQGAAYGQGKYEEGTNVTIFAVANDGYHFSQWNDGNTENPRTVTISTDAMYFANFAQDPVAPTLYELTVKPANAAQGWTTEGGAYEWGKQLMVYAHPASGFAFSQWSDGNKENPRFLTISGNISLTAQFEVQKPNNINSANASTTATSVRKVVRNGQAFIEYGDKTYTLQGVEVK
ncbi:leucine-rich repeat protein [Prevotella sp. E2-28]|uniref:leucine-rich repeat protein n=1 Tax=Prevotella sp. E2-28 TaxID=2913620 RepID=UPI001EDA7580|nr:leucine-rich repeat protein [Prevotella sp. E2-28]UKK54284.1 leucine-rich repeat protein [Prevotella sp. E2-28]